MYGIPQNNVKRLVLLLRVRETLSHFSFEEEILCKYTCSYTLALSRLHSMSGVIHLVQTRYRVLSLDAGCLVLDRWILRDHIEIKKPVIEIIINILSKGFGVFGHQFFMPSVDIHAGLGI